MDVAQARAQGVRTNPGAAPATLPGRTGPSTSSSRTSAASGSVSDGVSEFTAGEPAERVEVAWVNLSMLEVAIG
jgi:hypothetical protein